jgi:hypothetical protein
MKRSTQRVMRRGGGKEVRRNNLGALVYELIE